METPSPGREASAAWRQSRGWLILSIGSLVMAGMLALILVVGRVPGLAQWISDPLFAKRCLVVHVNLALGVWLFAFFGGLVSLVAYRENLSPSQVKTDGKKPFSLSRLGSPWHWLAAGGVALMFFSAAQPGVQPILSNYVPVLDSWKFLAGIGLFGFAVAGMCACHLIREVFAPRLLGNMQGTAAESAGPLPASVATGLRAAMAVFLLAMVTLNAAFLNTPRDLPSDTYYELLFWGPGHLLQIVHLLGMISVWLLLVTEITGKPPLRRSVAGGLFLLLAAPALLGPLLAMGGTQNAVYHSGFTWLMRLGTWPAGLVFLCSCLHALIRHKGLVAGLRGPQAAYWIGFLVSAGLTILGFILGAAIRGPNTMVPAHYHASVGGITAAYMAMTYWLAERYGARRPRGFLGKAMRWQPGVYGVGQMVFALGFGFAGMHGAARKAYGSEQHLHSLSERLGMGVMGAGGLVAMVGGLLFLYFSIVLLRQGYQPGVAEKNKP